MTRPNERARVGRFRAYVRYFRDPDASWFGKVLVLAALAYVALPVDLIPDVPIVGWLDDLGVMSFAVAWTWRKVGPYMTAPANRPSSPRGELEREHSASMT